MGSGGLTDEALVVRAKRGSDAAFATLVDRHQHALRGFLARVCPVRSEVDDLAQETFLAAWTSLRFLNSADGFRPWLMGIAWRKAKGAGRSAMRSKARDTAWAETQPNEHIGSPDKTLALNQALNQLSSDQCAAVALCLGAGLTHPEAAAALKMPLGTLKSHVSRGRLRLQEILGLTAQEGSDANDR